MTIKYVEPEDTRIRPVKRRGSLLLGQNQNGSGSRITTDREVFVEGRWRRVYVTQWSNAGSAWVTVMGEKRFLHAYQEKI